MKFRFFLTLLLCLVCGSAGAQDASYHTIGHASGIPLRWAALYFFFSK